MPDEVSICNSSLLRLGDARIMALSDDSDSARLCNELYAPIRDAVLRAHPWHSIQDTAPLGAPQAEPGFGFAHAYDLPTDFLSIIQLDDATQPYTIIGQRIHTSAVGAQMLYIREEIDPNKWDANLLEAVTARLTAEMAWGITEHQQLGADLFQIWQLKLIEAQTRDGVEGQPAMPAVCLAALRKLGTYGAKMKLGVADAARLLHESFASLRDALLRTHPWNFAIRRAQLVRIGVGDEVELVTNGTFDSDLTGWTDLSTGLGTFLFQTDHAELFGSTGLAACEQSIVTVDDTEYILTFDVAQASLLARLGTATGGQQIFEDAEYAIGSHTIRFRSKGPTLLVGFRKTTSQIAALDNVSCQLLVPTPPLYEYAWQYSLPDGLGGPPRWMRGLDIERSDSTFSVRRVGNETITTFGDPVTWKIEGRIMLSDAEVLKIEYIGRVLPDEWDPLFAEALAERIAFENASAITGDRQVHLMHEQLYQRNLATARGTDGTEGLTPPLRTSRRLLSNR